MLKIKKIIFLAMLYAVNPFIGQFPDDYPDKTNIYDDKSDKPQTPDTSVDEVIKSIQDKINKENLAKKKAYLAKEKARINEKWVKAMTLIENSKRKKVAKKNQELIKMQKRYRKYTEIERFLLNFVGFIGEKINPVFWFIYEKINSFFLIFGIDLEKTFGIYNRKNEPEPENVNHPEPANANPEPKNIDPEAENVNLKPENIVLEPEKNLAKLADLKDAWFFDQQNPFTPIYEHLMWKGLANIKDILEKPLTCSFNGINDYLNYLKNVGLNDSFLEKYKSLSFEELKTESEILKNLKDLKRDREILAFIGARFIFENEQEEVTLTLLEAIFRLKDSIDSQYASNTGNFKTSYDDLQGINNSSFIWGIANKKYIEAIASMVNMMWERGKFKVGQKAKSKFEKLRYQMPDADRRKNILGIIRDIAEENKEPEKISLPLLAEHCKGSRNYQIFANELFKNTVLTNDVVGLLKPGESRLAKIIFLFRDFAEKNVFSLIEQYFSESNEHVIEKKIGDLLHIENFNYFNSNEAEFKNISPKRNIGEAIMIGVSLDKTSACLDLCKCSKIEAQNKLISDHSSFSEGYISDEIAFNLAKNLGKGIPDPNFGIRVKKIPAFGQSGGVSTFCAMLSAAIGRPLPGDIAMTGALEPNGKVLEVGGIDRKMTIVAESSFLTRVMLPEENRPDFEKWQKRNPDAKLTPIFVKDINEIVNFLFEYWHI